jgi:hypothetical protein
MIFDKSSQCIVPVLIMHSLNPFISLVYCPSSSPSDNCTYHIPRSQVLLHIPYPTRAKLKDGAIRRLNIDQRDTIAILDIQLVGSAHIITSL